MSHRIAIVSNTSWSIYNFRLGLIRHLKSIGYQVTVVAPKDNFTAKLIAEDIDFEEINIINYGINPIKEIGIIRQLNAIYKRVKPDLIFHYTIKPNIYGSFAAHHNNIPSIAITTGLGHLFNFKNTLITQITIGLYKSAAKRCKEMWFLNDNDLDVFTYKNIVKKEKVKVLKSEGIDTDWFKPQKPKADDGKLKFLFAGRLLWDKGVKEFVQAAKIILKKYDNVAFEMLGFLDQNNPNSVPYESITEWQKAKIIKYLGETTDIRPFIEKTDCLLFPSFYREGISRVLMEAASMETPIITTDNVGCKDVVEDGRNGFLCIPKDVNDLVKHIEQFIALSHEDRLVMGKLGRKKMIKQYALEKIIAQYMETINKYLPASNQEVDEPHNVTV